MTWIYFREYTSSKIQNIDFSIHHKELGLSLFIAVKICRKVCKFANNVY